MTRSADNFVAQLGGHAQAFAKSTRTIARTSRTNFLQARSIMRVHTVRLVRKLPISKKVSDDYIHGALDVFTASILLACSARLLYQATRRYATGADIPHKFVKRQGILHGSVVSVNDGDNLRIRHTPFLQRTLGWYMKPRSKNISHLTINVRLAAVDAPECAHFGAKGQKYGPIARDYLRNKFLGRRVAVQVHSLDQYRRVVGTVWAKSRFPVLQQLGIAKTNVGLDLTKAGYATVYRQGGAQYGGLKQLYERAEHVAKQKRLGMWKEKGASPAAYKKAMRAGKALDESGPVIKRTTSNKNSEQASLDTLFKLMVDGYNYLRRLR